MWDLAKCTGVSTAFIKIQQKQYWASIGIIGIASSLLEGSDPTIFLTKGLFYQYSKNHVDAETIFRSVSSSSKDLLHFFLL